MLKRSNLCQDWQEQAKCPKRQRDLFRWALMNYQFIGLQGSASSKLIQVFLRHQIILSYLSLIARHCIYLVNWWRLLHQAREFMNLWASEIIKPGKFWFLMPIWGIRSLICTPTVYLLLRDTYMKLPEISLKKPFQKKTQSCLHEHRKLDLRFRNKPNNYLWVCNI